MSPRKEIGWEVESRTLKQHVGFRLKACLMTRGRMPFRDEWKQDAPGLWDDAAQVAIAALDEWNAAQARKTGLCKFECPIGHDGCTAFCGSYGCGG